MKKVMTTVLLVAPLLAFAADKSPDQSFYKNLAEGGISEVEAGKLAESKGSSQAVKDFGAMMVKDHNAASDTIIKTGNMSFFIDPPQKLLASSSRRRARFSAPGDLRTG